MTVEAEKHIHICIKVKNLVEEKKPMLKTFLTTHSQRSGYRNLEEKSGEEFWSLRMYKSKIPNNKSRVKDPDIIVVKDNVIKYVIEVKWGYMGNYTTDLNSIFQHLEMDKFKNMISESKVCKVIGPKVIDGNRINKKNGIKCVKNDKTIFLLISDFKNLDNLERKNFHNQFQSNYSEYTSKFILLDIEESFENIYSFQHFLIEH